MTYFSAAAPKDNLAQLDNWSLFELSPPYCFFFKFLFSLRGLVPSPSFTQGEGLASWKNGN